MAFRMPVLGQHHVLEAPDHLVDRRNHLVPVADGQRPAGAEIVLDVDDDEDAVVGGFSHGNPRICVCRRER